MQVVKNKVFIVSIILWVIITLVCIFNHIPWLDEAHAWTIAEELNLFEIFRLMKVEGHTFIWYLLLMPFAKTHFLYPYSMQILNWSFCFASLLILWKKAPFNNFVKVLITFSFPFLALYSVYARCYAIGIMLLFLLTVYFKDKLRRPVLYSILLVLCANTSVMALFGAVAFGVLFLYEIYKSKVDYKKLILPTVILATGSILLLLQLFGSDPSALLSYKGINFDSEMLGVIVSRSLMIMFALGIPLFLYLRKRPQLLFFITSTTLMLSYCFMYMYYGSFWHHAFYYIYFIITCWLALGTEPKNAEIQPLLEKTVVALLILISVINGLVPLLVKDNSLKVIFNDERFVMARMILEDRNLDGKTIILGNDNSVGYMLLPYNRYKLVNYCLNKQFDSNFKHLSDDNEYCYKVKIAKDNRFIYFTNIDIDRVTNLVDADVVYSNFKFKILDNNKFKKIIIKDKKGRIYSIENYKCSVSKKDDTTKNCITKIKRLN